MNYLKLIGIGLALIAIAGIGWKINGWRHDSAELAVIKPAYDGLLEKQRKANEKVEKLAPVDEAAGRKLAEVTAALTRQQAETSRAWGRVRALQETINAETGCPVVRLSDGFGMCLAAAATGNAADAAACQAGAGDGPIPPG